MSRFKYPLDQVLSFNIELRDRGIVKRYYVHWRTLQGMVDRCDNPDCNYHTAPLVWNDRPLTLILDHENGNKYDNRPENLRFLCPNCDSQLETRGGANRNRVQNMSEGGFEIVHKDGHRDASVAVPGAEAKTKGQPVKSVIEPVKE